MSWSDRFWVLLLLGYFGVAAWIVRLQWDHGSIDQYFKALLTVGIIPFGIWVALRLTKHDDQRRAEKAFLYQISESNGEMSVARPVADVPEQLRYRARTMRNQSIGLLAILFLVFQGTYLAYSNVEHAPSTNQQLADRVDDLSRELSDHVHKPMPDIGGEPDSTASDRELVKRMEELVADLRKLKSEPRERDPDGVERERFRFYASIATRVGAVILLIFLAQFLINGYRYNLRRASAYEARADALALGWPDAEAALRFIGADDFGVDEVRHPLRAFETIVDKVVDAKSKKKESDS